MERSLSCERVPDLSYPVVCGRSKAAHGDLTSTRELDEEFQIQNS